MSVMGTYCLMKMTGSAVITVLRLTYHLSACIGEYT